MNLSYYTSLPDAPPKALSGLRVMPVSYGQNFADNYGKLAQQNETNYGIDVAKTVDTYRDKRNELERQSVLGGLQMLSEAERNEQALRNDRLQRMTGLSGMLGGLYR